MSDDDDELFTSFDQFPDHQVLGVWINFRRSDHTYVLANTEGEDISVIAVNTNTCLAAKRPHDVSLASFITYCEKQEDPH